MKNILLSLTLCLVIFSGTIHSFADSIPQRHAWEAGTDVSSISYREPGVMRNSGIMYGLVGSYTYRGWLPPSPEHIDRVMLKIEIKGSYGQVDYRNSGSLDNIDDFMFELRGLGGYDFSPTKTFTITPYIGIGYRYLLDDASGKVSSTGALGYKRESNYFYSPVGIETFVDLKHRWSLGVTAEYDIFWSGKQISHLSDVDSGYNDPENRQKHGYGVRGSFRLQRKLERLSIVIEPFIKYWNIGKSDNADVILNGIKVGEGYEPKNNSTEIGLRLAVRF